MRVAIKTQTGGINRKRRYRGSSKHRAGAILRRGAVNRDHPKWVKTNDKDPDEKGSEARKPRKEQLVLFDTRSLSSE